MSTLYTFFISVIVLEVLCIVGIIVAFRKLHQWKVDLMNARIGLSRFRFEFTRAIKTGSRNVRHADTIAKVLLGFAPPWVKAGLTVLRWLGKVSPKTS